MQKTRHLKPSNDSPLAQLIAARIAEKGPVTVAEYMELALGHPEHGYYTVRDAIGRTGDFTTAPEISQMYGEMVAAWLVDAWLQSGRPESVKFIELGPGRGTLAADVLRTVSAWPDLKSALSVHLVETSPRLRQVQFDLLKDYNPLWYEELAQVPEGFCLIVANEFFDAMPVHQLEKTDAGWMERRVDWHAQRREFFFVAAPTGFDVEQVMPPEFVRAPVGSVFEVSPASLEVLGEIARRVATHGGAALIADYGHVMPGLGDTLQAVSKHKFSSALEDPGIKDITAHVDFGTFRSFADETVCVHGPVPQGAFLTALGIFRRAEQLRENATPAQKRDIMTGLHRLTAPSEMGGVFKVMGLTRKDAALSVAGFDALEIEPD